MDPAQFSAFQALLALLLIGNTIALATQAVTARHIVASDPVHRADETAAAWRTHDPGGGAHGAFWLVISPLIGWALRAGLPDLSPLALTFFPLTVMGGALGIAQGHETQYSTRVRLPGRGCSRRRSVTIAALVAVATLTPGIFGLAAGCAVGAVLLAGVRRPVRGGNWPGTRPCCADPRCRLRPSRAFALTVSTSSWAGCSSRPNRRANGVPSIIVARWSRGCRSS